MSLAVVAASDSDSRMKLRVPHVAVASSLPACIGTGMLQQYLYFLALAYGETPVAFGAPK